MDDSEINSLRSTTTTVVRKRYRWLLGIVGVSGLGDLLREWLRGKAVDFVVSRLGWFGDFLVGNPVALTSIGIAVALTVLTVMVVSESKKEVPSIIYEHRDKGFLRPPPPHRWVTGFILTMVVLVAVICFGSYKYWLYGASRRESIRVSVSAKTPDVSPSANAEKPAPVKNKRAGNSRPPETGESAAKNSPEQRVPALSSRPDALAEPQAIPAGAPPNIIPQDPVKAVEAVDRMRQSLVDVIGKKDTITFLISWPKNDNSNLAFVSSLISDACRQAPRQCWFTQEGDPRDLDRPPIPSSGRPGITVHGTDANMLASALGVWFVTHSLSTFPPELNGYKERGTKEILWIEIGPGSIWKPTAN